MPVVIEEIIEVVHDSSRRVSAQIWNEIVNGGEVDECNGGPLSNYEGARLTAHRATVCARDDPANTEAGCARCHCDSSRIVFDKAHEADCRSPVVQNVHETGCERNGGTRMHAEAYWRCNWPRSPRLWMYKWQCDAMYRPSKQFRRLWKFHKCDSLIEKLMNLSLYHETNVLEQDSSALNE